MLKDPKLDIKTLDYLIKYFEKERDRLDKIGIKKSQTKPDEAQFILFYLANMDWVITKLLKLMAKTGEGTVRGTPAAKPAGVP
jgi:hypothetical protein